MYELHERKRGLTIVELMVVVAVVAVVLGLTFSVYNHAVRLSRQTVCVSNLRQISIALNAYHTQYRQLPEDDSPEQFDRVLGPFIQERGVLHCPADPRAGAPSYAPYYVRRREMSGNDFILGCPRHGDGRIATVLYGCAGAKGSHLGPITHDGAPVKVGDRATGGLLRFADGSVASLGDGVSVDIVTSFQCGDGSYYTVLRMPTGATGAIGLDVNPNSRLEVVTPAAIAGSEGTVFYVILYDTDTKERGLGVLTYVKTGKVRVQSFGQVQPTRLLTAGQCVLVQRSIGAIVDCQPPSNSHLPTLPGSSTH